MKPFKHKQLVAYYRAETWAGGRVVLVADGLLWKQALYLQEKCPAVSIRFSYHQERLIPDVGVSL